MRLRSKSGLALVAVVASACLPGGRLPELPTRKGGTLDARGRSAQPDSGPFRVAFAGPEGDDLEHPQPQLVFSRPVRALGQHRDEPKIDARFSPPMPGRWEWIGTSAARFVPEGAFDKATTYRLEVAPTIRSLDGEPMAAPVTLTFSTRRPTLDSVYPAAGEQEVSVTEIVRLHFSQVIPRAALEKATRVVDRAGRDVPFVLEQDGDTWNTSVQLKPKGRWPEGERLTVKLASGITGTEGVLPMIPRDISFDTLSHLHVVQIDCGRTGDGRCYDGASVGVQLSGDMRPSDLRRLVTIKPAVKLKPPTEPGDVSTAYHSLEGAFVEGVKYEITVAPAPKPPRQPPPRKKGEAAEELRQLKVGAKAELVFAPADSGVRLSFHGTYVPPSSAPIAAKAEETKKAIAGAVGLTRSMVIELANHDEPQWWELAGAKSVGLPIRASKKAAPGWLSLAPQTPTNTGPVLFGARWEGFEGKTETLTQVLQRSDLALLAKVSPEGTLAWVTSLTTGLPVEGAKVEARDASQRSVSAVTGKDGVALLATADLGTMPPEPTERWRAARAWMVLFVERGDEWIYQRVEVPKKAALRGTLFDDRGLYRPGETVHLKGMARRPTAAGFEPVVGETVTVEVRDPKGKVTRQTETLSAWGTFDHAVTLAPDAPLGSYSTAMDVAGARVWSAAFRVKEYRPSTFSVETHLESPQKPEQKSQMRGDQLVCTGRASYLYGGSLEGAKVAAHLSRQRASFEVPGLKGFSVRESENKPIPPFQGSDRSQALDATGRATFAVSLDLEGQTGPELVSCDVTVTDPTEEMVAASAAVLVHPAPVYVALEDHGYRRVFSGETLRPKVLVVTPEGTREKRGVRVDLVQHLRDPKKSWASLPGKSVANCMVTTGPEPQSCALVAPTESLDDTAMFYLRASLTEGRSVVTASTQLYPGKPPKIEPPKPKKIEKPRPEAKLDAGKRTHARNEVAHLKASSSFEKSQMLFTVEREGIREHKVMPATTAPIDLDVPMDDATGLGVRATATFVSPLSDHTVSRHMLGATADLDTGFGHHALRVTVKPPKSHAAPGEELDIDVDVRFADGQAAATEVTLYAADEGTLTLADYKLPDPLSQLFRTPEFTVSSFHTRDALGHLEDWEAELRAFGEGIGLGSIGTIGHGAGTGTGQGFGSGSGRLGGSHGRPEPRRNFAQTAFFLPSLVTDAQGHARAHVKLPDSLTTYRVMAFAVTKRGDVGAAEAPIVTSMPLQVRPSLPRVIRAGDKFTLGMMVANNGTTKLDTKLEIEATGLTVMGERKQDVALAAGQSRKLTFEVEAKGATTGKLVASISAGKLTDSAELPFEVVAPVAMETVALHGAAEGRVDEKLGDLGAIRADVGSLELVLSSSPLAGLGAGLEQLVQYPYGCTEQTTSRLVPLLPLRALAKALGVALPSDLDKASRDAVRHLIANQRASGGFGLWPGSTEESAWLSVYATWGLETAKRHGVPVEAKAHAVARAHLLAMLARYGDTPDATVTAPFALDVLVNAVGEDGVDADSLGVIADQLFDRRATLPPFSRALLLHAMGKLGSARSRIDTLTTELTAALHIDGAVARYVGGDGAHAHLFDSPVRTSALVLRALLVASPKHPLVTPLALGLVHDRRGGTWRNTQETAWALLALDDYRALGGESQTRLDAEVWFGGTQTFAHTFQAGAGIEPDVKKTVSMADVLKGAGKDLSFIGRGTTPLYYQARLSFAPRGLPTDDVASGLEIHRRYYVLPAKLDDAAFRAEGWKTDGAAFTEGATILSEIEIITTSPRRFVVVDDPLPGGFESLDLDLQGGPRWLRRYERRASTKAERHDDRVLFFADELRPGVHRFSHLVRAMRAGTFVTPPAHAEEMYAPETFGRTAGRMVVVR